MAGKILEESLAINNVGLNGYIRVISAEGYSYRMLVQTFVELCSSAETIQDAVNNWINEHPEAVTTVEDGSITEVKLSASLQETLETLIKSVGGPNAAITAADMTDQNKIYVYTGSEAGYTYGNWYYFKDGAWVSGGVYNSTALETDTTLTVAGMAADAKATGDRITGLKNDLGEPSKNLFGAKTATTNTDSGITATAENSSITFNGTATAGLGMKWYFNGSLFPLNADNGETLTMSYEVDSGSYSGSVYMSLNNVSGTAIRLDLAKSITFQKTSAMDCINIWINSGATFSNFKINIQIEKGSSVTPFCRYGGVFVNDKIARADVAELESVVANNKSLFESVEFVTNRFADFEVGTLTWDGGQPSSADYRLRSINFIPFDNFYMATWEGSFITVAYCYDENYSYLGATPNFTNGVMAKDDITGYQNIGFIKLLFATDPVGTITLDALATANFQLFTVLAYNNLVDAQSENDLPSEWIVPYRSINQMQDTGFTFAIQTDTHYYNGIEPIYYNSLKNLSRRIGFDFIANLGDIIRGYEYDTVTDSYEEFKKAIKGLVDGAECSTFALMGNHDNGAMYATATGLIANAFLPGELFSLFERPTTTEDSAVVWGSREGLYFYRDFDRVRVVVLNTSDLPYQAVSASDISVNVLKISDEQVSWFSSVALSTNKPVLVLSHAPLDGTNTIINRDLIVSAMESFVSGGGTIIANVAGHTHNLGASKTNGINYIVCDNGGDICEVFAIDLDARTITTQQIGKDFTGNRSFTF